MSKKPNQQDPLRMKAEAQLAHASASTDHAPNSAVRTTQLASLAALLAVVVGALVLVGWAFDIVVLKSILPGWFPMKPNAAVGFILTGIALWLTARQSALLFSRLARVFSLLAGLLGVLTLGEYMFGWNLGIDQWLFREPAGAVGTSHPGRMAQEAALNFVLLSVALWITGGSRQTRGITRARWTILTSVTLGLLVATLALASILSHLTPGLGAYGWFGLSVMALHAAMTFALLGVAVMALSWQPDVLPWSLSRRTTAAFACGMVVLVFIGFNASRSQFWMKETNRQSAYSEAVLSNIASLLIEVIDVQADTRGYVITGDEQFKTHYLVAQANSNVKLDALRKLVADHPHQQQQLARIEASVNTELQWFQQVVDAERIGMTDAARNNMISHGEVLLHNLRETFDQIESEHQQHIQQLKREAESVSRLSYIAIFIGTFASLLIFMITIFRLNFAVNERARSEAQITQSLSLLHATLESTKDAILVVDLNNTWVLHNQRFIDLWHITDELIAAKDDRAALSFVLNQLKDADGFLHKVRELYATPEASSFDILEFKDGKIIERYSLPQRIDGKVVGRVWSFRDITERKQAEQKLRDSLREKEVLMREINHRVKNNLQMMSALLELQSSYVKDGEVQGFFKDSQQRIQSMAMIHEQLYHNKSVAKIDFAAYLHSLVDNLRGQFSERCSQVNIRIDAQACTLPVDIAIPCGLVISELVSNAFKHAFPNGRAGELRIGLQCVGGKVVLEVADDGVGLPAESDRQHSKSFGMQVVRLMVEKQLHGKLSVESNQGTRVVCEIGGAK